MRDDELQVLGEPQKTEQAGEMENCQDMQSLSWVIDC